MIKSKIKIPEIRSRMSKNEKPTEEKIKEQMRINYLMKEVKHHMLDYYCPKHPGFESRRKFFDKSEVKLCPKHREKGIERTIFQPFLILFIFAFVLSFIYFCLKIAVILKYLKS